MIFLSKKTINKVRVIFLPLLIFVLGFNQGLAQNSLTPEQVAQKAASVISQSKGISANFTLKGNGRSGKGSIKNAGNKFTVTLPDASIWYNGKDLYTYNPRTGETTVVTPTAQELLEANPLLYVKGGAGNYNYSFSPVKKNGKYVVEMTPQKNKSEIKKMSVTLNSANYFPEKIIVTTTGGSLTIDIDNFNSIANLNSAEFEYPKNKYPKVEVIDLR